MAAKPKKDGTAAIGVLPTAERSAYLAKVREANPVPQGRQHEIGHCGICGHLVWLNTGLTTQGQGKPRSLTGEPCGECGRRSRKPPKYEPGSPEEAAYKERVAEWQAKGSAAAKAHREAGTLAEPRRHRRVKDREEMLIALMREKAEAKAEAILKPFFAGLELEPKDDWSANTKLQFFMNQATLAGRILDRTVGMPVARTRAVDKEDNDVPLDQIGIPASAVAELLVAAMSEMDNFGEGTAALDYYDDESDEDFDDVEIADWEEA